MKKLLILILIITCPVYFSSCSSTYTERVKPAEIAAEGKIIAVILVSGDEIGFNATGGTVLAEKQAITGTTKEGKDVEISMSDILYVRVEQSDPAGSVVKTIGLLALIGVGFMAVMVATKQSCPFIYSYDGEKYVFDAEPLGGTVSRGLGRSDYSRLDFLKADSGYYKLMITNEVLETQFIDKINLQYVDHPVGTEVVADPLGNLHIISRPQPPFKAVDEEGNNLLKFVGERDNTNWQTTLPNDTISLLKDHRQQLTFSFLKPKNAEKAHLLFNAGTALWGSRMIREMLHLRGEKVKDWYADVDSGGAALAELYSFVEREELFILKVWVKERDGWKVQEFFPAGGPLVLEDRVVPIDLSNVEGDTVEIRLNPPRTFWAIDYMGLVFNNSIAEPLEISIHAVTDFKRNNSRQLLSNIDNSYLSMEEVGEGFLISFKAPVEQQNNMSRTVFVNTTGYYELHLPMDTAEQTEQIQYLLNTPGAVVKFSLQKYIDFKNGGFTKK